GGQAGRSGEQRYRHRTVAAHGTGVQVAVGGRPDAVPGERELDLVPVRAHERGRVPVEVADGRTAGHRYLLGTVEHRGERAAAQERVQVHGVADGVQLAAYRATGELRRVQVGVEPARVGLQLVEQRLVGDGHGTGRGVEGVRQRTAEERDLHGTVAAGGAGVEVASRRRADSLPLHRVRDLVALDPDDLDGLAVRVADGRTAGHRYLVSPDEHADQERGVTRTAGRGRG